MKVSIELDTPEEVNIIGFAMLQVATRREEQRKKDQAEWEAEKALRFGGFKSEPIQVVEAEVIPEPTVAEAKAALLAYADAKGMGAAVALLAEFDAKRVGEVTPGDRANFIARTKDGAA